jgi:hypothetical protein
MKRDYSRLTREQLAEELLLRTRSHAEKWRDVRRLLKSPKLANASLAQIAREARVSQYLVSRVLYEMNAGKPAKLRPRRTNARGQVIDYVIGADGKKYPAGKKLWKGVLA